MWGKTAPTLSTPNSTGHPGSGRVPGPIAGAQDIRQFTGSSMRSILADVRSTFGRDAIILKQESRNGRIRVTACSEGQLGSLIPADDAFGIGPIRETGSRSSSAETADHLLSDGHAAGIEQPIPEVPKRNWWGGSRGVDTGRSQTADIRLLLDLDYSESFVEQLVNETDGAGLAERVARSLIAERGSITADGDTGILRPGAYRFSGPSGHGKSSLIAKLATAYVLAHGSEGVVLASTDLHRLGGTLKLARLAELLGTPFNEIDAADVPALSRERFRLLLIDTDGQPATGSRTRQSPVDIVGLSAVAQPRLLARALAGATPASVVALTHLDQAETIGAALSVLVADERADWPLEWLGFGQSIDDCHCVADLATVSQWALRGVDRSGMRTNFS